jgi:hypothetical protein
MLLEEIRNLKTTSHDLKKFGFSIGLVLLIIAAYLFWKDKPAFSYLGIAGILLILLGKFLPGWLSTIYRVWMAFALVMGFIMTRVILTAVFFGLITPMALVAKLLRKDLLSERWHPDAESYWVKRPAKAHDPAAAEKMY